MLNHIRSLKLISKFSVIISSSDSSNDSQFIRSMFIPRDSLSFFHKHRSITLMLEFVGVSEVNRHDASINMEFSDNRTLAYENRLKNNKSNL